MQNELQTDIMMSSNTYSLEQIKAIAPSVFTTEKAPHLTDKYIQTPTSRVVEDLMSMGWQVTKAQEVKARKLPAVRSIVIAVEVPRQSLENFSYLEVTLRR
jgi:hypothetical protein